MSGTLKQNFTEDVGPCWSLFYILIKGEAPRGWPVLKRCDPSRHSGCFEHIDQMRAKAKAGIHQVKRLFQKIFVTDGQLVQMLAVELGGAAQILSRF